jgi:hypothetical protein
MVTRQHLPSGNKMVWGLDGSSKNLNTQLNKSIIVNIAKALSTLSLAFALQAGALVAATVIIAPSDAAAATHSKTKPQKKSQKKAPARGKIKTKFDVGDPGGPQDNLPRRDKPCCKGVPDLLTPPPHSASSVQRLCGLEVLIRRDVYPDELFTHFRFAHYRKLEQVERGIPIFSEWL